MADFQTVLPWKYTIAQNFLIGYEKINVGPTQRQKEITPGALASPFLGG